MTRGSLRLLLSIFQLRGLNGDKGRGLLVRGGWDSCLGHPGYVVEVGMEEEGK